MGLLNNPLLCGDGTINGSEFFDDLVNKLKNILEYNIIHNPWFSKYFTNFEKFHYEKITSITTCSMQLKYNYKMFDITRLQLDR
jgi:hypothetical protein